MMKARRPVVKRAGGGAALDFAHVACHRRDGCSCGARDQADSRGAGGVAGSGQDDEGPFPGGSSDEPGGPPARRLREQLERELGEVPHQSPSESADEPPAEEAEEEDGPPRDD